MQSSGLCKVCEKPADLKCAACYALFYCGKDHQKAHWPKHRKFCRRPYEMKSSPKLGHYVVAARDIRAGEPIYREDALAIGPRHMAAVPGSCPGCYRALPDKLSHKCPECEWPVCSKNCPGLSDSKLHGSECELLKIVKKLTKKCQMELLLPLRCLLLQTTKPKVWESLDGLALEASLKNVNYELDPQSKGLLMELKSIVEAASHIIPDGSPTTLKNIYALLNVSGRELYTPYSGPLAAVYAVFTKLIHSCVPNVTITVETLSSFERLPSSWRGRATIKATKAIPKGGILTFPFVNAFYSTLMRTKELRSIQDIRCSCARCLDPSELGAHSGTLKCLKCEGYVLPVNPAHIENSWWLCDKGCGTKFKTAKVEELQGRLFLQIGAVRWGGKKPTTDNLDALVRSLEQFLHPRHYLCTLVKHLLSKSLGEGEAALHALSTEKLMRKSALSKEVWTSMSDANVLLHGATNVAECLMEQFRADFELLKRYFNSKKWNSGRTVEAITECRSLLSRISEVCRSAQFYPPRAQIMKDAVEHDIAVVSWAKLKGLELHET